MLRWLGAGLTLCGAALVRRTLVEEGRRSQRTRRQLATALEAMEAEIRALLTPLPRLLRRDRGAEVCEFFVRTAYAVECGKPLGEAWSDAVEALALSGEERAAVAELGSRLDGGEESVCAALSLSARALRRRYDEIEQQRSASERIVTSVCVAAGLTLVVLLI